MNSIGFLAYVGAWATTCTGTWLLFERIDSALSITGRSEISSWLRRLKPVREVSAWPDAIIRGFSRVFGENPFSLRFFTRCCGISALFVLLLYTLVLSVSPNVLLRENTLNVSGMALVFLATVVVSWVPDYLSLIETRYVIVAVSNKPTIASIVGMLILDASATLTISVLGYFVGIIVFKPVFLYIVVSAAKQVLPRYYGTGLYFQEFPFRELAGNVFSWIFICLGLLLLVKLGSKIGSVKHWFTEHILKGRSLRIIWFVISIMVVLSLGMWITIGNPSQISGLGGRTAVLVISGDSVLAHWEEPPSLEAYWSSIWDYLQSRDLLTYAWLASAFLTSIWVWLCCLAAILIRFVIRARPFGRLFLSALDIEQKPFRSIGVVVMIFITILFLFGLPGVLA